MRNKTSVPVNRTILLFIVLLNAIVIKEGYIGNGDWYFALILTLLLLVFAITNTP